MLRTCFKHFQAQKCKSVLSHISVNPKIRRCNIKRSVFVKRFRTKFQLAKRAIWGYKMFTSTFIISMAEMLYKHGKFYNTGKAEWRALT